MGNTGARYLAAICAGLLVGPVAAQSPTYDTRPITFDLIAIQPAAEIGECLSRRFDKLGMYPVSYQNPDALIIEGEALSTFGGRGKALVVARIVPKDNAQLINFRYRHPVSKKYVEGLVRDIVTRCLPGATEAEIAPAAP